LRTPRRRSRESNRFLFYKYNKWIASNIHKFPVFTIFLQTGADAHRAATGCEPPGQGKCSDSVTRLVFLRASGDILAGYCGAGIIACDLAAQASREQFEGIGHSSTAGLPARRGRMTHQGARMRRAQRSSSVWKACGIIGEHEMELLLKEES